MKNFINVFKNKFNKDILKTIKFYSSNNNILLHWYDINNNFGDQLNLYLLKNLFNINVFSAKNIFNYNSSPVFSVIGSILDNTNYRNLEIWGSGFMYKNSKMKKKPKKIYAVRGPLTRQNFINNGINCPKVYGDPGILISEIYNPKIQKKYKLGIIPHYVDKGNKIIDNLFNKYPEDIKIIDIQDNIENVIDNIKSCEYILSSSLHGLIAADSYYIPNLWLKLSNDVLGKGFKFHDYFLSLNRGTLNPIILNENISMKEILNLFEKYGNQNYQNNINKIKKELMQVCPFNNYGGKK